MQRILKSGIISLLLIGSAAAQSVDYIQQLKNKASIDDREPRFSSLSLLCSTAQTTGLPVTLTKSWATSVDLTCGAPYIIGNGGSIQPASGKVATFTVDTSSAAICDMSKGGTCTITGIRGFVSPTWFNSTTPIQSAVTSSSSTSFVLIPRTYQGTDTYQAGGINNVEDLRLNAFSPYQWITPSRPITGYPMGNDLALDVEGPADASIQHGGLCGGSGASKCPSTTTTTSISAGTQDITVDSSLNFGCSSLQNPSYPITCNEGLSVWVGTGTATQETCLLNSITSLTVMNITCQHSHSGTTDVEQLSVTAFSGQTGIVLGANSANCPTHATNYCPQTIGTNQGSILRLPTSDSAAFPDNTIRIFKSLTGAVEGGSHGEVPNPAVLVLQNAGSSFPTLFKDSSGNEIARFADTTTSLGENATTVHLGDFTVNPWTCSGTCTVNFAKGVGATIVVGTLTTSSSTTTTITLIGAQSGSRCQLTAANSSAATMLYTAPGIYISSTSTNSVTVTHGSGLSGAIFFVSCAPF